MNFKLFIIMDTDDCSQPNRIAYEDGSLFSRHILAPYIIPIYNNPNLEATLSNAGIIPKKSNIKKGFFL